MTHPYSVVSIEDDVNLFDLLQAALGTLPVNLYHAKTGVEALSLIPRVKADAIILDIALPDIQGWDVLKRLNESEIDLKGIIVLTGRTDPAHRVMAHFQNVTAFISKPFEPAELRQALRTALNLG